MIRIQNFNLIIWKFLQMSKLLYTILKISGGQMPQMPPLVARLYRRQWLGVRWCYDVPLGRCWGTNDGRKSIKLDLVIYCDFMQGLFHQMSEEGQNKPRNTSSVMFGNLWSNVISFLCSKDFWLGWGKRLEKGVRTGAQLLPKQVCQKTLISRQSPGYFCTLDLTQIFE